MPKPCAVPHSAGFGRSASYRALKRKDVIVDHDSCFFFRRASIGDLTRARTSPSDQYWDCIFSELDKKLGYYSDQNSEANCRNHDR